MGHGEEFIDASESRTITAKEAAILLGVSQSTIYRMFNSGELVSFKVRNARRTSTAACERPSSVMTVAIVALFIGASSQSDTVSIETDGSTCSARLSFSL